MLYSINQIQGKLAANPAYREKKPEIMQFFHVNNIFDNIGIDTVYTSDSHPPFFLKQDDIKKVCAEASKKFGMDFDYKNLYEGNRPLLTVKEDEKGIKLYSIKNAKEIQYVVEDHYINSSYGRKEQEKEARRQEKKDKEAAELAQYIEEKKKKEWEEFDRATNLTRDLFSTKIISIDFEFFLNKKAKTHIVTEIGITAHQNGAMASVHFLVDGEYQKKKNQSLQRRFAFGETKVIQPNQVKPVIEAVLKDPDFVLFHEQREDFEILNKLGIKIPEQVAVIDTQLCHKRYFREKGTPPNGETLENLLKRFNVDSKDLHNAGNDAYFTLKLLFEMKKAVELNLEKTHKKTRKP